MSSTITSCLCFMKVSLKCKQLRPSHTELSVLYKIVYPHKIVVYHQQSTRYVVTSVNSSDIRGSSAVSRSGHSSSSSLVISSWPSASSIEFNVQCKCFLNDSEEY